jgi:L-galactose dehydrogenase
MRYRTLGKTGLSVSMIGFGASSLGNVFGQVDFQAATRAVIAAIDLGVNLFDVSPFYGLTLAEERLGKALEGRRSEVFLGSKCGRYGFDNFDFSAKNITREFDNSLRRLRTDYLDILQAHDIEFGDVQQIVNETIPAMQQLKQQGKVRFIGLTGYWPAHLASVASQADVDCVLNYCHANLFVDDMDRELVPFAQASGIGLLNASPLHMGLLTERPVPAWHPAPPSVRQAALAVRLACRSYGVDPGTLAVHLCLKHDVVASTLVGISTESEIAAACAALDWTPPQELLYTVRDIVAPVHNLVWPSGLQENQNAPAAIRGTCDVSH